MIICAAIKFHIEKTGRDVILFGVRHANCFEQLVDLGFEPKEVNFWIDMKLGLMQKSAVNSLLQSIVAGTPLRENYIRRICGNG